MVECNGLENRRGFVAHREFESLLLRHFFYTNVVFHLGLIIKSLGLIWLGVQSTKPRRGFGSLAQLVEQLAFNQLVGRSSRPRPTILPSQRAFVDTHKTLTASQKPYCKTSKIGAQSTKPCREFGSLAQLVEQLAFNQLVGRSSRPRPTINNKKPSLGD